MVLAGSWEMHFRIVSPLAAPHLQLELYLLYLEQKVYFYITLRLFLGWGVDFLFMYCRKTFIMTLMSK